MSTPPMPIRASHKPINLAKIATVFALTFSLAFGLCSVSGISISGGGNYRVAELLKLTSANTLIKSYDSVEAAEAATS